MSSGSLGAAIGAQKNQRYSAGGVSNQGSYDVHVDDNGDIVASFKISTSGIPHDDFVDDRAEFIAETVSHLMNSIGGVGQ